MDPPALDSETLTTDWLCVRCGYNLRGLNRSGRCPECNTPIPRSLRTRYLSARSPCWLRAVRNGALILIFCNAAIVVRSLIVTVLPRIGLPIAGSLWLGGAATYLLLAAIGLVGEWLLAKPEPRSLDRRAIATALWIRRLCLFNFAGSVTLYLLVRPYFVRDFYSAWIIGQVILGMFINVIASTYLAELSRHIPDPSLAGKFWVLRWLGPLGSAVGTLMPWTLLFFNFRTIYRMHWLILDSQIFRISIQTWSAIVTWQFARALMKILQENTPALTA